MQSLTELALSMLHQSQRKTVLITVNGQPVATVTYNGVSMTGGAR